MSFSAPSLLALALIASVPATTSAQSNQTEPASTFSDLALQVPSGSAVVVTDQQGQRVRGKLTGLSGSSLSLAAADRALTFAQKDVVEVRRELSDSVWNGGLIGLIAGFAGPAIFCTIRSDSSETVPCVTGTLLFGGLPGLAIGAIVDSVRTRKVTVFRLSPP